MDAPVEQAAHVLAERKIGRALVVDDSSQVVGLLSMADIALAADDKEMVGDLLKHVSERYF
jgi:CBS domain-containing protein